MPWKVWVAGEEVIAADWNQLVQEQVTATFATAAARTAAITTPKVGQITYLVDSQRVDRWDGSAWRAVPYGDLGYSAQTTNSGIYPLTATTLPGAGFTIPAARLPAGRIVQITFQGIVDVTGATNAAHSIRVNGTQIGQTNVQFAGAGNTSISAIHRYVATGVQAVCDVQVWQSLNQGAKLLATPSYPFTMQALDIGAV